MIPRVTFINHFFYATHTFLLSSYIKFCIYNKLISMFTKFPQKIWIPNKFIPSWFWNGYCRYSCFYWFHQSMRVPHSIQIEFRIIRRVVRLLFHRLHKHLLPPAISVWAHLIDPKGLAFDNQSEDYWRNLLTRSAIVYHFHQSKQVNKFKQIMKRKKSIFYPKISCLPF